MTTKNISYCNFLIMRELTNLIDIKIDAQNNEFLRSDYDIIYRGYNIEGV